MKKWRVCDYPEAGALGRETGGIQREDGLAQEAL